MKSLSRSTQQTAVYIGSGSLEVLATPVLVTILEEISQKLLGEHLSEGLTSVGISLDVRHLAPTPVGNIVGMVTEVDKVDRSKVRFSIQAWDEHDLIFTGKHSRAIIQAERFLQRVESKRTRHEAEK